MTFNEDRFCKKCAYPLKKLTEPRCPECAREFDLKDATTYSTRPRLAASPLTVLITYAIPLAASVLICALTNNATVDDFAIMIAAITTLGPLGFVFERMYWFSLGEPATQAVTAAAIYAMVVLTAGMRLRRLAVLAHLAIAVVWLLAGWISLWIVVAGWAVV